MIRSSRRRQVPAGVPDSRSAWSHSSSTVARYSRSDGVCGTRATDATPSSVTSCPSTVTDPPCRRPAGWSAHSSDDFPEPLRPMSATTSPAATCEVDAAQRDHLPVANDQARGRRARSDPSAIGRGRWGGDGEAVAERGHQATGVPDRQRERIPAGQPAESDDGRREGGGRQPGRGGRVRGPAVVVEEHDVVGVLHHPLEPVLRHDDGDAEVVHEPVDGGEHLLGGGGVER